MDSYRQLQAEKWKRSQQAEVQATRIEQGQELESPISVLVVDSTSLVSVSSMVKEGGQPRSGILFGTVGTEGEGFSVIVDAIYEVLQDSLTGEILRDSRLPMVRRISKLMGLRPVGIMITGKEPSAADIVQLLNLEEAVAYTMLILDPVGNKAFVLTPKCHEVYNKGQLTRDTTLTGKTVNGGLDGTTLQKQIAVVKREVNTVIHTGFYRLNRSNHIPTFNDVKAFIITRRDKAKISDLYLQLADYHLLLFLADSLGETTVERIILAIFQEEDALIEDLMELLLSSNND